MSITSQQSNIGLSKTSQARYFIFIIINKTKMEDFWQYKSAAVQSHLQFNQMKQILLSIWLVALVSCSVIKRPKYTLSFDCAARERRSLDDSKGNVYWNGQLVYSIVPTDYLIKTVTISLQTRQRQRQNVLQFEGAGLSNSYGLTIDNVKLFQRGSSENEIINGGFEDPNVGGGYRILPTITGWEGNLLEIGNGKLYNSRWNSQVAELDSHNNYKLTQKINDD